MGKRGIPAKKDYFHVVLPNLKEIERMVRYGYSIKEIAQALNVTPRTYYKWKQQYTELDLIHAPVDIKNVDKVKKTLVKEILGYEYTERHVEEIKDKDGNITYSKLKKVTKWIRPNSQLLIFFLCNKCPDEFKRQDTEEIIRSLEVFMSKEVKDTYGD